MIEDNNRYEQCKREIGIQLREKIDLSRDVSDEEIHDMLDDLISSASRSYALSMRQRDELGTSIFHSVRKMDILQELIDADDVTALARWQVDKRDSDNELVGKSIVVKVNQ